MQPTKHNVPAITLIALALLSLGLAFQGQLQAANLFQSPLPPPPDTPCSVQTLDGFTLEVFGYVDNGDSTTTLTYRVTNTNKKDISYLAFGVGSWRPLAPNNGTTTTLGLGDYHVEWTNEHGNPGFASIKYETQFDSFSQGAQDTFTLTVGNFDPATSIQVQMKAGKDRTTFTLTLSDFICNRTPTPTATPFSPLPTPTLPVDVPDIAVYILQDSDYETPLNDAEKAAIWERGDPVPDTEIAIEGVPISMHIAKPGLAARIPNVAQQAAEGWSELYHESFDDAFPQHGQQYGGCHLELLSTDPANYQWGGDQFRTHENSAGAAWLAKGGALGAVLMPGTDTYPSGITTQIICQFSDLDTTTLKNIMTEFALWLDEADTGDTFFVGFNTGEPLYYGKRWQKTPVDNQGNPRWERYRLYYPELAEKVAANEGKLAIMWSFTSDDNHHADAQGAWLDELKVERYVQPTASASCEDLADSNTTSMQVQDVPGTSRISKGLNLAPYVDGDYDLPVKMARLQATGTHWVRLEFTAHPSAFIRLHDNTTIHESIDLKHFDQLIDSLCATNIAVLGLIDYTSVADKSWEATDAISDSYLAQFQRTTEILVDYYDDRIKAWEIWNEPDATATRLNEVEYTKLLVGVSPIIRDANDQLVFGGFVGTDDGARDYLQAVYSALEQNHNNIATPFDVFAVHPYPSRDYVDEAGNYLLDPSEAWQVPDELPNIFRKFQTVLLGANALTRNDSDKEIWVTEFGWNAAKGSEADQQDACLAAEEVWVTQDEQAHYLATGFDILFKETAWPDEDRQSITKAFWYSYNDTGINLSSIGDCVEWPDRASFSWYLTYLYTYIFGPGPDERTEVPWHFGLYHSDWQPKTLTHCAFNAWPFWPDECIIDYDYAIYLPLINREQPAAAAGE